MTPGTGAVSRVFGAFFDGQGVLGAELHNQMYVPLVQESVAAGSPARCAELTADWFERILRGIPPSRYRQTQATA